MSAPVDSAQRCQRLVERLRLSATGSVTLHHTHYRRDCGDAADMVDALRAALDAAERERDEARDDYETAMVTAANADATGYARGETDGIRKAAALFNVNDWPAYGYLVQHTILALLPETKETSDA